MDTYAESLEAMIKALDELVKALNESIYKGGSHEKNHS